MSERAPHRLVEELEARIRPVETRFRAAYWDSQVSATPENERRRSEFELELRQIKGDADARLAVEEALNDDLHEPELRRQLEVLRLTLTANQMDEWLRAEMVELIGSIEGDFATHRPLLDGKRATENDIQEVLSSSDDSALRSRAWTASKEIGGLVAPRVRELARLRNAAAVELGYPDYFVMALDLQEMSESWLFDLLDEVDRLTDEPFRRWKEELDSGLEARFGTADLMPWHYSDPFFQLLPVDGRVSLDDVLENRAPAELAEKTFADWGIGLSEVIKSSDLYPREGKSQHAFCLDVDRTTRDVRVLANIVPGERWTEIVLHECGHAAYDVSINTSLPYFLHRAAHTFVTEAMAILCGRLVRSPRWLTEVAGIDSAQVAGVETRLHEAAAAQSLLFARWVLVVTTFEQELYRDPEGDLDARWWELSERFQYLSRPAESSGAEWAAKVHVAAAPAYYHNYLLGEILATQLESFCEREYGGLVGNVEAGAFMAREIFASGASRKWDDVITTATGGALSPRKFVSAATATRAS